MRNLEYRLKANSPEWVYVLKHLGVKELTFPNCSFSFQKRDDKFIDAVVKLEIDGKIEELLLSLVRVVE